MFTRYFAPLAFTLQAIATPLSVSWQAPYERDPEFAIEHDYVVHFKANHTLAQHMHNTGINITNEDGFMAMDFLPGYNAKMNSTTIHEIVRRDPGVSLVENNCHASLDEPAESGEAYDYDSPQHHRRYSRISFSPAQWNQQMVSAGKKLPIPVKTKQESQYDALKYGGQGVHAYVLDTGIRTTHRLFAGRAVNFKNQQTSPYANNEPMDDYFGHGTHVAGIVGALNYGIADWATLVNVKVFAKGKNPDGDDIPITNSVILAQAVSDVVDEHLSYRGQHDGRWRGSVINMSIRSSYTSAMQTALKKAFDNGVPVIASAGNKNINATQWPCASNYTICVASVDSSYQKSSFSNWGETVQMIAPGSGILSLSNANDTAVISKSGTSMAAPHVAGAVAIWIYWEFINNNFYNVFARMRQNELDNIVTGFSASTKNRFLTTGINHPDRVDWQPYSHAPKYITPDPQGPQPKRAVSVGGDTMSTTITTTQTTTSMTTSAMTANDATVTSLVDWSTMTPGTYVFDGVTVEYETTAYTIPVQTLPADTVPFDPVATDVPSDGPSIISLPLPTLPLPIVSVSVGASVGAGINPTAVSAGASVGVGVGVVAPDPTASAGVSVGGGVGVVVPVPTLPAISV